jgi:N6-adenosine-specific RNA methylase IME4
MKRSRRKFSIIYADPPWAYRDKCHSGQRGAGYKYSTMAPGELAALPVCEIAARDAVLFMWATYPQLETALALMRAWGFTYKTVAFTWVKRTKHGRIFWGMGNWSRANAEIVLLGVRGRPKRRRADVHQIIEAPIGRHSAKPAETRRRIVRLCGRRSRVELFARNRVAGWAAWGNEIRSTRLWR